MTQEKTPLVFETRNEFQDYCDHENSCELSKLITEVIFEYVNDSESIEVFTDEETGNRYINVAEMVIVEDAASVYLSVDIDELEDVLDAQLEVLAKHDEFELCVQIKQLLQYLRE